MNIVFIIVIILGILSISLIEVMDNSLPEFICLILGIICIIIGVTGLVINIDSKTNTVVVTTIQGQETFKDCTYNLYDDYIKIEQDEEVIIFYNPVEIKVK